MKSKKMEHSFPQQAGICTAVLLEQDEDGR
jgi:hypothetical protein